MRVPLIRQHGALVSVQGMVSEGERLFHDDLYVVIPDRIGAMFVVVQEYMRRDANIRVHLGKIKVWNVGGIRPRAYEVLQQIADAAGSRAFVWRGSDLPTVKQGIKVLGTPLGHEDFVAAHLRTCWNPTGPSWNGYRWCRTSSVHGLCCFTAP